MHLNYRILKVIQNLCIYHFIYLFILNIFCPCRKTVMQLLLCSEHHRCNHSSPVITMTKLSFLPFFPHCLLCLQDALASFDFLNKRNSMAVKPDLDGVVEQEIQHPDLELTAIQKDTEIRLRDKELCALSDV